MGEGEPKQDGRMPDVSVDGGGGRCPTPAAAGSVTCVERDVIRIRQRIARIFRRRIVRAMQLRLTDSLAGAVRAASRSLDKNRRRAGDACLLSAATGKQKKNTRDFT